MGASWNNTEIKVEQVPESVVKLQSYAELKTESAKGIRDIRYVTNNMEKKQSLYVTEYIRECQNSINEIRYSLERVFLTLGLTMETKSLNEQLYTIIYKNTVGTCSEHGFLCAAKECHRAVESYCESILAWEPNADDLKQVEALKYMIGENRGEDVFDVFFKSIVNLCKKLAKKLESQYQVDYSKEIFGAVGSKMASEYLIKNSNTSSWMKAVSNTISKPDDKIFKDLLGKIQS